MRGNCVHFRLRGVELARECAIGHDASKCDSCPHWQGHAPPKLPPEIEKKVAEAREAALARRVAAQQQPTDAQSIARRLGAEAFRKSKQPWRDALRKAWQFLRAVGSWLFGPRLSRRKYELRIAECLQCPERRPSNPVGYCNACGCGQHALAELSVKARMPAAKCPKNRWPVKGKRSTESPTPLEVSATKRTLQQTDSTDSPTPLQS